MPKETAQERKNRLRRQKVARERGQAIQTQQNRVAHQRAEMRKMLKRYKRYKD